MKKALINPTVLAFITIALTPAAKATLIIAIRTSDVVFIASNSYIGTHDRTITGSVCKTGRTSNIFWAHAGIVGEMYRAQDPDRRPNFRQLATGAIKRTGGLAEAVKAYVEDIVPAMSSMMEDFKKGEPGEFNRKANNSKEAMSDTLFAGLQDGVLTLAVVSLFLRTEGSAVQIAPNITVCPGDCQNGNMRLSMGKHEAVLSEFSSNPAIFRQLGWTKGLCRLMNIQVAATPEVVKFPASIIALTAQNHVLRYSAGACSLNDFAASMDMTKDNECVQEQPVNP